MLADRYREGRYRKLRRDEKRSMTEQNRNYVTKEIGKLLSEIWRIKGLAEQEYGSQHPITKKLSRMHTDAQELLQEKSGARNR